MDQTQEEVVVEQPTQETVHQSEQSVTEDNHIPLNVRPYRSNGELF